MSDDAAWGLRVMQGPPSSSSPPKPPPPPLFDAYPSTSAATPASSQPLQSPPAYPSSSYASVSFAPAASAVPTSIPIGANGCMVFTSLGNDADHMGSSVSHLQSVLVDIRETEQRREKKWLNVQPCVLHAVKLLAATAQTQSERIRQLEDALQQLQESTTVLVRDRELKEERYRLDTAIHQEEVGEMRKRLDLLDTQQRLPPPPRSDLQISELAKTVCEEAVKTRVAPLQQQLRRLRRRLKAGLPRPQLSHIHRHLRSSSVSSDSSTLTARDEACRGNDGATVSQRRRDSFTLSLGSTSSASHAYSTTSSPLHPKRFSRRADTSKGCVPSSTAHSAPHDPGSSTAVISLGTKKMIHEVQRLRRQWRHRLHSVPAGLAQGKYSSSECDDDRHGCSTSRFPSRRLPCRASKDARSKKMAHGHRKTTGGDMMSTCSDARRRCGLSAAHSSPPEREPLCVERASHPRSAPGGASTTAFSTPLPASGRRIRWYWSGDAQSHFSTAVHRAEKDVRAPAPSRTRASPALGGVSPALPWSECHAFNGPTDCWYSLGSWATHRRQLHEAGQAGEAATSADMCHARLGWMRWTSSLVSWSDISTLVVERAGIYRICVCLLRYCASSSLCSGAGRGEASCRHHNCGGALTLWVNNVAVAGIREEVTHTLLYTPDHTTSLGSSSLWWAALDRSHGTSFPAANKFTSGNRGQTPASASRSGSPAPRRSHGDIADRAHHPRSCCEPAQLHTNTLTAHLFLPVGAALQVRCRGLHDTKTVHEAFCELEYVV